MISILNHTECRSYLDYLTPLFNYWQKYIVPVDDDPTAIQNISSLLYNSEDESTKLVNSRDKHVMLFAMRWSCHGFKG